MWGFKSISNYWSGEHDINGGEKIKYTQQNKRCVIFFFNLALCTLDENVHTSIMHADNYPDSYERQTIVSIDRLFRLIQL